jgi:peptide/nickel transport system ATP-binding protein
LKEEILTLKNFSIQSEKKSNPILNQFSWNWESGKVYSLIGESGSGKTSFAYSLFGIYPKNSWIEYSDFYLFGREFKYWESTKWKGIRGKKISMIPQNPHLAFHPYRKMGVQINEYYASVLNLQIEKAETLEHWKEFGIRDPEQAYDSLPNQLSGGEKQRICISMAHFSQSELILADEPTTALDPIQEKNIIQLLLHSVQSKNRSLVLITHNLKLMLRIADEVMVIKSGKMVELKKRKDGVFSDWKSEYACELLDLSKLNKK